MRKIRLVVAEKESLYRECMCAVLRTCHDIEVVGEATNAQEAMVTARQQGPDVIVMNLAMAVVDICRAIRLLQAENRTTKLLLMAQDEDRRQVIGGLRTEADGYISRKATTEELISAVRTVYQGGYFLQPSIARTIAEDYAQIYRPSSSPVVLGRLTPRERRILEMFADGREREEIARSLHIEPARVLASRARIMRKLGVPKEWLLSQYATPQSGVSVAETAEYGHDNKSDLGGRSRVGKERR